MKNISDNIKSILSIIIILLTFGILILILFQHQGDKEIVSQVLIAVVGGLSSITGYYYGYSQGASKKDEAAASQLANSQTTSTATTVTPIVPPEVVPTA